MRELGYLRKNCLHSEWREKLCKRSIDGGKNFLPPIVSQLSKCLKFMTFGRDVLKHAAECKNLSKALETLSPLVLQKMKEDYFSQLDDYNEPFCEQQYKHGSRLLVCSISNPLISLISPNRLKI